MGNHRPLSIALIGGRILASENRNNLKLKPKESHMFDTRSGERQNMFTQCFTVRDQIRILKPLRQK